MVYSVLSEDPMDSRFNGLEDDRRPAVEGLVRSIIGVHDLKRGISSLIGRMPVLELVFIALIRLLRVIFTRY